MTDSPFVATLRARPATLQLVHDGASALTIRAQLASAWDAVRITVAPTDTIVNVKANALGVLDPGAAPSEFYVTLRGAEVLDEHASIAGAGVINGSTLLISHRHRRPVR